MRYANDNANDYNNARMITILERLLFKKRKTLVVKMDKKMAGDSVYIYIIF